MKISKNLLIRIILIIILGLLISALCFIHPTKNYKEEEIFPSGEIQDIDFGLPKVIKIPLLNVNSEVEYVGILPDGTMGVPQGPKGVAWYSLGVPPGAIGNSVMAGHSGWKDGITAIFDNLAKLKKGDKVLIEDGEGKTIVFIVSGSQSYDPEIDATNIFVGSDGKSHLNLITCSGSWNPSTESHTKRLVVFTDRE